MPPQNDAIAIEAVRHRARTDPAVFACLMLEQDALPDLHCDLHEHRVANPDCAVELPRGHGKTTECAIGELHAIAATAVASPDLPLPRLKVVVVNDDEVHKTGRVLRDYAESPCFRWVFPELAPDDSWWNIADFRIVRRDRRRVIQRDPTVEVRTILGAPGGRWDRIWFDDICGLQNSIIKPALRTQVRDAVNNTWMPMRDKASPHRTASLRTYTPWHEDDQGMAWRKYHAERGTLFRRPVIDFRSPWPDVFDADYLRELRVEFGPTAYERAYGLVPVSQEQLVFVPGWITGNLWTEVPDFAVRSGRMVAIADWAFTTKSVKKPDPDWSVCLFARIDPNGHVWVVDIIRQRCPFPEFLRAIADGCRRWGVREFRGESNGPQAGLVQQAMLALPGVAVSGIERSTDMHTRATVCQSQVERGMFHLRGDGAGGIHPAHEVIYEELLAIPAGTHDDAASPALDLLDMARARTGGYGAGGGIKAIPLAPAGRNKVF